MGEPVVFSIIIDTPSLIRVKMRFPMDVLDWVDGTSAVTDGPMLQRYEQRAAERKRVQALIETALAPVVEDAYRVMENVRTIIASAEDAS